MFLPQSIGDYFDKNVVQNLNCEYQTKSYIVSIFNKFKSSEEDYSKKSITLVWATAKEKNSFSSYQSLADWLFWTKSIFPEHLAKHSSEEYSDVIAQLSYWQCYKMINKQWKLYEELSDNFPLLVSECRNYYLQG